jgi:hypothetical protein
VLLQKDKSYKLSPIGHQSFKHLKNALLSKPILCQPDFKKPFFILCDASNYGIGAILCQRDENGEEYVVSYFSELL